MRTALYDTHLEAGARMVPFSGWDMPVQYSSIREEHTAVRTRVGLFDVSHMGEFSFQGEDGFACLRELVSSDVDNLEVNRCQYGFLLNASGGTVDDAMVYRVAADRYLMVVNAGNVDKDWAHVQSFDAFSAAVSNESDAWALLALQGPEAGSALQPHVDVDLGSMPFHGVQKAKILGFDGYVAASGYTGENGFELFVPSDYAVDLWMSLADDDRVCLCGLGARDTLRIEASLALYGHELDEDITPIEANLGFGCAQRDDYMGADVIQRQRTEGTQKRLVMIEMRDRAIPRQGYAIQDADGGEIGTVTSGTAAPWLKTNIGMGYVDSAHSKPGTTISVRVRDKAAAATVVKRPFYKRPRR